MRRCGTCSKVKPSWPSEGMHLSVSGQPRSKMGRAREKNTKNTAHLPPFGGTIGIPGALHSGEHAQSARSDFDPEKEHVDVQKNSAGGHVHSHSLGGRDLCPPTADSCRDSHGVRKPVHPLHHLRQTMLLLFRTQRRYHRQLPARRSRACAHKVSPTGKRSMTS